MTYYTSWISDEELLEILEDDPLVFQSTLDFLRGGKNTIHILKEVKIKPQTTKEGESYE